MESDSTSIEVSRFASARVKSLDLLTRLQAAARPVALDPSAIDSLMAAVQAPLFNVAVTGPSRAGKSTLVNALVGAEVSPVGTLPTTGVPCMYQPGTENMLRIVSKDGSTYEAKFSIEEMRKWATQEQNPDNTKNVARIEVDVASRALDLGYALIDLPGLDDAGDDTHSLTEIALEGANCVIYVMNGSDFSADRFIITRDERMALERVARRIEKTFFVVNKSDELLPDQREKLKGFIEQEFRRFKFSKFELDRLDFVSALRAFDWKVASNRDAGDGGLSHLEKSLYDYLIGKSVTGRARLAAVLAEANELVADQVGIAALALEKSEKVLQLRRELLKFDEVEPDVQRVCSQGYADALARVSRRLGELQIKTKTKFEQYIRSIPLIQPLPTRQGVKAFLDEDVARVASEVQSIATSTFESHATVLSQKVQALIQSFRQQVSALSPGMAAVWSTANLGQPIKGNMFPSIGGAVGLGLIGLAFGPIGALVGAVIGFFGGLIFGESQRRAREIDDLVPKYDRAVSVACDQIAAQADRWISASFEELQKSVLARLKAAKTALREQLEHLGEPLSAERKVVLEQAMADLAALQPEIQDVLRALA